MSKEKLLAKIKAEIKRLITISNKCLNEYRKYDCINDVHKERKKLEAYNEVLSFISNIEEPSSDDLKKEVKKYISKDAPELWPEIDDYEYTSVPLYWMYDFARHFAEWGTEHTNDKSENPVPNNAEEAAKEYARYHYADTLSQELAKNDFLAGSAWKEVRMMKDAVEGEIKDFSFVREINYASAKIEFDSIPELKEGDKVRVIVLPKKNEK